MGSIINELFMFATDPEVKRQLQTDLNELHGCMEQERWKAAVILIGSLIEAVLYYHINNVDAIRNAIPGYEHRNITLNDLLVWARDFNIIDANLFRLAEPIDSVTSIL